MNLIIPQQSLSSGNSNSPSQGAWPQPHAADSSESAGPIEGTGQTVRLKHGTVQGTVIEFDMWTYLCRVAWADGSVNTVHRMYLEVV